jgi:NADH-quinone oxidoreductase subunit N
MNLGAFAVVVALARKGEFNEELDDFAGLGFQHPFLGATMSIFMLSLAGIPALAGFTGKLFLFSAAVKAGYIGLAVIAVLNSVVSVYYYAGVLVKMYMTEGAGDTPTLSHRPHLFAALLITASGTILLGIFPGWAFDLAQSAFSSLG